MSPTRVRRAGARALVAVVLGLILIAAAGFALIAGRRESLPPRAAADRPRLMLLTTLPLVFGDKFGLEGAGSPALKALETRYVVQPISVADGTVLAQGKLLLMAHPLAQPAEVLVDLDSWVRRGGRVLLLADPTLDWPSERPLGDPLRPPAAFADTGLLKHWGLRLDAPVGRGPKTLSLGGQQLLTASPGELFGACAISKDRLTARCRLGKGQAMIVADADFLNVADLDGPTDHNLKALLNELAKLEQ